MNRKRSAECGVQSAKSELQALHPSLETRNSKLETALLEIGVEDIPASYFPEPLEQMKEKCEALLSQVALSYERVEALATPRRLALIIHGLAARATPTEREVKGPPAAAAFDSQGKPTAAAIGFARAQGVELDSLIKKNTERGEYVFARLSEEGKPAEEILPRVWVTLILSLSFPKTMRWKGSFRFVRPIRWLVGMLGPRPLPFTFEGLTAGRTTRGHRFTCGDAVAISDASKYVEVLREAGVMVDQEERRNVIEAEGQRLAGSVGGVFYASEELLEEVTFMCEHPTLFLGNFDPQFLTLPERVLETIMRKHQRYFAVHDQRARLLPHFIGVRDGDERNLPGIKEANERVLRARLKDGIFFFQRDMRRRLEDWVVGLEKITFQEGLGTMRDKAERLSYIVRRIGEMAGLEDAAKETCGRAAWLCKVDLLTEMVKELPELQGVVGGEYARRQGEPEGVAKAVEEHYMPQSSDDAIPSTAEGQLLSLADKLDTLCSCLSIGLTPTGSEDPYGLRRAGHGAVRVLFEGDISHNLRLEALVNVACEALAESGIPAVASADARRAVEALLIERMRQWLLDKGIPRDVVNAAIWPDADRPREVVRRAFAITDLLRAEETMSALAIAATRVMNILNARAAQSAVRRIACGCSQADVTLFQEEAEKSLYEAYKSVEEVVSRLELPIDYRRLLEELTPLVGPVGKFFDAVLVMTEDERLRANRLALLWQVRSVLIKFGGLWQLEMDGGTGRWLGGKQ